MFRARPPAPLARLVLAWFVLALGLATAAPLLQPAPTQVVCTADGELRIVAMADDGTAPAHDHALHCPLCLFGSGAAPAVPGPSAGLRAPAAKVAAVDPAHSVIVRQHSRAPLPARGPPPVS